MIDIPFRSKELSWLSFNARVLQEASNPEVPLLERIKFLGIYSSNMDEFFRVRVATLKRLVLLNSHWKELNIPDPKETLFKVNRMVAKMAAEFDLAYRAVLDDLAREGVILINETAVPEELKSHVSHYFQTEVKPYVLPIMLKQSAKLPNLNDMPMYLAIRLSKTNEGRPAYALIQIPSELPRFFVLPKVGDKQLVMFLDDVIRFGLPLVFAALPYDVIESYAIKFTRDAELEVDDDFTESFYEKMSDGLKAREVGDPVRANYDKHFPPRFLQLILQKLGLANSESLYPGSRYHNRRDLLKFPNLGGASWVYEKTPPIKHPLFKKNLNYGMFAAIRKSDVLLHIPYHSFGHFIDFIHEAAIDPYVQSIQMTQYRLAKSSQVAAALQSAAMNGKEVSVVVEPQARFDESANIRWASLYRDSGVKVILGVTGLKVHAKMLLVTRKEGRETKYYAVLGTGNFNEDTASIFADHLLFTHDQEIGADVAAIFEFFRRSYRPAKLTHLIAAPLMLREFLEERVAREIKNHQQGKPAGLSFKVNNLSDYETAKLLYRAAAAGVRIRIIARGMYSLQPTSNGTGLGIQAIGIVDKYLEHSRILIFENNGDTEVFLSSADFLPRNFDTRVETVFPVLSKKLARQLIRYFELQWSDNTKARILDADLSNQFRTRAENEPKIRAQFQIPEILTAKNPLEN
jgi:polyphosphate kinase